MASIVRMPELVTGSAEAAIAAWLVAVGDEISAGQPIVEIETEKATVEYEAEASGVLAGTLLEAGTSVEVGTPIAVLATGGQSAEEALAEAGAASGGDPGADEPGSAQPDPEPAPNSEPASPESDERAATADPETPTASGERRFASPLVRKLVRERGLDLSGVQGTGPNGRIVRRDLDGLAAVPVPAPAAAAAASSESADAAPDVPSAPKTVPSSAPEPASGYTDVPHTGMRRAIARRLTESKSTVPHFYLVADCRMDALLELRAQVNALEATRVSVNDFVVKAVAAALQDVPGANAIWTDDATRRFDSVDISVAVSVPDGLFTPVVRGVEKLSLGALSREIRDYAERARAGRLKQHELEGGSFSVSNLGMYGTSEFSAILNPPQAGILAVGAAEKRPVVQDDGALGVATIMTVTLSADHRVLDGALAAEWLAAFTKRIESPMSLLV
ncbi:pyruvate dehydrogenase complex dihydrolipoamide acetyltransferase [Leucobacter triazinivorans]|uniref:Acetyltransferase component of pyruvate dehydrogenase complex n=1 Tax=Leucobacter triazinivorans TaxID=1784719 RepID=A0A4V0Z1P0_9MICO|nr:pyruvate dehydrogenase complex dihydrolipoamide acetyltransferase [Leucobacter triazinivorans]QBE49079.1 pyruvate dehydrogenase complex dihydrolipoamide acetyltransferase [Leucobacter triazinivorans]